MGTVKQAYYSIVGSVKPLEERLSKKQFRAFLPITPNACSDSERYIEYPSFYMPQLFGKFSFVKETFQGTANVDISEIVALSNGKGLDAFTNDHSGRVYSDLDTFAKEGYKTELDECISKHGMTREAVEILLSAREVRVTKNPPTDSLIKTSWSGRISLSNDGGAHHFAAARYIAKEIGYKKIITTSISRMFVDKTEVKKFMSDYMFLLVHKDDMPNKYDHQSLDALIRKLCLDKNGRWHYFPNEIDRAPFKDFLALFFSRTSKTEKVCAILKDHGAFDYSGYLLNLS